MGRGLGSLLGCVGVGVSAGVAAQMMRNGMIVNLSRTGSRFCGMSDENMYRDSCGVDVE